MFPVTERLKTECLLYDLTNDNFILDNFELLHDSLY